MASVARGRVAVSDSAISMAVQSRDARHFADRIRAWVQSRGGAARKNGIGRPEMDRMTDKQMLGYLSYMVFGFALEVGDRVFMFAACAAHACGTLEKVDNAFIMGHMLRREHGEP